MHIQLEPTENHSIEGYSEDEIKINKTTYQQSLIVSANDIITDIPVNSIQDINQKIIDQLLEFNPEIIIIGHHQPGTFLSIELIQHLAENKVGVETMQLGAACRTYNVVLSELRNVVGLFIL